MHSATFRPQPHSPGSAARLKLPRICAGIFILALALFLVLPFAAQSPAAQSPGAPSIMPGAPPGLPGAPRHASDPSTPTFDSGSRDDRRVKMLNVIRQKSMVSDASKILILARELDADAAAGGSNLSPAERLHKAAEIEKLARSVREKMTFAVGDPIEPASPFGFWVH